MSVQIDSNLAPSVPEGGLDDAKDAPYEEQASKAKGKKLEKKRPLIVEIGYQRGCF